MLVNKVNTRPGHVSCFVTEQNPQKEKYKGIRGVRPAVWVTANNDKMAAVNMRQSRGDLVVVVVVPQPHVSSMNVLTYAWPP
jgi:hypothetical protein